MNPILTILLLILQITLISSDDSDSFYECVKDSKCFINGPTQKCLENSNYPNSYQEIEDIFNNVYATYNIININQIQCGSDFEKCASINPEDIKDKCYNVSLSAGQCCYMKLKYQHNTKYACYPIEKSKSVIKNKIKDLKKYYVDI